MKTNKNTCKIVLLLKLANGKRLQTEHIPTSKSLMIIFNWISATNYLFILLLLNIYKNTRKTNAQILLSNCLSIPSLPLYITFFWVILVFYLWSRKAKNLLGIFFHFFPLPRSICSHYKWACLLLWKFLWKEPLRVLLPYFLLGMKTAKDLITIPSQLQSVQN